MDTGIPTPNTDQLIAAKQAIAEFEEITEVAKPAAPKNKHKIIQVKDVRVGDLIFLHTLGTGPYFVAGVHKPNHPALKGSLVIVEASRITPDKHVHAPQVLSYQFTQSHMEVEVWEDVKTRNSLGLCDVNPNRRVEASNA